MAECVYGMLSSQICRNLRRMFSVLVLLLTYASEGFVAQINVSLFVRS